MLEDILKEFGFMLFGVPAVPVVKMLVDIAKKIGMPTKFAFPLAVFLGVVCSVLLYLSSIYPVIGTCFKVALTGLAVGASSGDLYDLKRSAIDSANASMLRALK